MSSQEPGPLSAEPRLLGGRYVLEERLAAGGMATVWRAHDETLARTVAVKLLHDHLAEDTALRERFRREAVASARLGHPGIVGVYDTGDDHRAYLVMEYVEGETLRETLALRGRLELEEVAAIGVQAADALAYAHAHGLVHRDVKPANLLVDADGSVKITDFGIAKAAHSARDLTQTGTVLGTAAYVAPEQVRGDPVDGRADQYALGCVLYEAVTGRRPFESDVPMTMATKRLSEDPLPPRAIRPDVPRALDEVLLRTLAREPEDRYPDARALATALAPWASEGPAILAAPETEADEEPPPGARSFLRTERNWLAPVLALLVVAGTLVGAGMATGVLESGRMPSLTASEEADPAAVAIDPEEIEPFDPVEVEGYAGGDGWEHDQLLDALVDGDPETFWRTERYQDVAFGGTKPGVGAVIDLGQPHTLHAATVRTPTPGVSYEIRVADEPSDDADDWATAARADDAAEVEELGLDGAEGRYVLLYIVPDLVPVDGGALAAFSELELRGAAQ